MLSSKKIILAIGMVMMFCQLSLHAQTYAPVCIGQQWYGFIYDNGWGGPWHIDVHGGPDGGYEIVSFDAGTDATGQPYCGATINWKLGGSYKVVFYQVFLTIHVNNQEYDVTITPYDLVSSDVLSGPDVVLKASHTVSLQAGFHYTAVSSSDDLKGFICDCSGNQITSLAQLKYVATPENTDVKVFNARKIPDSMDGVLVYPNPTDGIAHIVLPNNSSNYEIKIYNSSGKQLYQKPSVGNTQDIDFSTYPRGIYIIQMIDENGKQFVKKIQRE